MGSGRGMGVPAVIRGRRLAIVIALTVLLMAIALIVLSPARPDAQGQEALRLWLNRAHKSWLPRLVSFGLIEWLANVLMFLPLGFLVQFLFNRWKLTLASAVLLSSAVELTQAFLLPQRFGSVADVLANSIGAALGICLYVVVRRWVRARAVVKESRAA